LQFNALPVKLINLQKKDKQRILNPGISKSQFNTLPTEPYLPTNKPKKKIHLFKNCLSAKKSNKKSDKFSTAYKR
jgi:hypothetical protein